MGFGNLSGGIQQAEIKLSVGSGTLEGGDLDCSVTRYPAGPLVLVCGGADYADRTQVLFELDMLKPSAVIHETAPAGHIGAAALAEAWCGVEGIPSDSSYTVDGIDIVLAFPGADKKATAELAEQLAAPIKHVAPYTRVGHCRRHPYNVYGGRPGPFGNPFSHDLGTCARYRVASRDEAIEKHAEWFLSDPDLIERIKREMTGKVIGCWCAPKRCHCDIYARVCNEAAGLIDTTGTHPALTVQESLFEL